MRISAVIPSLVLGLLFGQLPAVGQKVDPWRGAMAESRTDRLERPMDPLLVQSTIDGLNEDSNERYGHQFIVKYHLDLGPLNRVQVNPELWKSLTPAQRRLVGGRFARAFKGTGVLFCQFFVDDARVGKVRSDPIRGGLRFEIEN